jgi:hypothetical protein
VHYEPALTGGDNNAGTPPSIAPRPTGFDSFGRPFAAGENTRLYFNRSDLNKSVIAAFDYIRNDDRSGGVDTRVRTQPVLLTINRADGDYAYVDLAEEQHKVIPPTSARSDRRYAMAGLKDFNSWGVAGNITGASVKVRVIYRDTGTRAPRDLEEMARQWRIQDVDTFVSQL